LWRHPLHRLRHAPAGGSHPPPYRPASAAVRPDSASTSFLWSGRDRASGSGSNCSSHRSCRCHRRRRCTSSSRRRTVNTRRRTANNRPSVRSNCCSRRVRSLPVRTDSARMPVHRTPAPRTSERGHSTPLPLPINTETGTLPRCRPSAATFPRPPLCPRFSGKDTTSLSPYRSEIVNEGRPSCAAGIRSARADRRGPPR